MNYWLRGVILFLTIFSEVHIKAENHSKMKVSHVMDSGIELPENCLHTHTTPCAFKSLKNQWIVKVDGTKVVLSEHSAVVWSGERQFQVIDGEVWFADDNLSNEFFHVKTEYGKVLTDEVFNLFVKKTSQQMEIYPIFGSVKVIPLGDENTKGYHLPAGYRSHLRGVTDSGQAHYEIPTAANLKGFIESWAPLFDGTPQELAQILANYRKVWIKAVNAGAEMQEQLVKREIASEKTRLAHLEKLRKQRLEEERYLKLLFRKKNYLD